MDKSFCFCVKSDIIIFIFLLAIRWIRHKKGAAHTRRYKYRVCIKNNAINPSKLLQYHQANSYQTMFFSLKIKSNFINLKSTILHMTYETSSIYMYYNNNSYNKDPLEYMYIRSSYTLHGVQIKSQKVCMKFYPIIIIIIIHYQKNTFNITKLTSVFVKTNVNKNAVAKW